MYVYVLLNHKSSMARSNGKMMRYCNNMYVHVPERLPVERRKRVPGCREDKPELSAPLMMSSLEKMK